MNKKLLLFFTLLLFLVQTKNTTAQQANNLSKLAYEYASSANENYWKNRKPFIGYWQQDVHYQINATLIDTANIIDAIENLVYVNNSPDTLTEVYFHLYQNAFIKGSYLEKLNLANGVKQTFGKYEASGKGTEIENLTVNGAQAQIWLDNSILKVVLNQPLFPENTVVFSIKFKTYFDNGSQRRRMKFFTDNWGNKQFDAVHWYPRISVYDRKFKWTTDQHLSKEFYGDFGSFDVKINVPNHYIVDATGELQNRSEVLPDELRKKLDIKNFAKKPWDEKPSIIVEPNGTFKTWHFKSINTHDFAWVADPTFRIGEDELTLSNGKKVSLIALAQEPHASGWQDAATFTKKVISVYSNDIGNYIYPKMICVDARDGMEYPMLTLDGGSSPGYYGLIAHEVGHNWFFGMVGNNETYRASLDEGFTQFLTHWSTTRIFGENKKPRYKNNYINKYARVMPSLDAVIYNGYFRDAIQNQDKPLNTHSDYFDNALAHGGGYGNVYYKTATMLYNLQYVLGDELFISAMQNYFNQWKTCHPYFEDFRASIIDYTKVDLNWFFDQWLETTKHTDYAIKSVKRADGDKINITLKRLGEMQMPIDLTVVFSDSSVQHFIIPNTYFAKKTNATVLHYWKGWGILNPEYSFTVNSTKGIKNVYIDPTHRLADINELNNSRKLPLVFTFDHQLKTPPDRRNYYLKWRPDIWWNALDGIKAGLHFNGNYYNLKHVFSATVWYNTQQLQGYSDIYFNKELGRINYNISYQTLIVPKTNFVFNTRYLDGLFANTLGLDKTVKNSNYKIYFKSLYRQSIFQTFYVPNMLIFDDFDVSKNIIALVWNGNSYNNSLNLEYTKNYNNSFGWGKIIIGTRASALLSDFNYASVLLEIVNYKNISNFEFKTRIFSKFMSGSIAPESRLFLAGANPEEYMDNKFTRSAGIINAYWLMYGNATNHFQFGGGLNLRGYNGYIVPTGNFQNFMFSGNNGSSINVEIDFDKYFRFEPKLLKKYFHLDSYLFADAGFIGNSFNILKTNSYNFHTPILADAGLGFAFTIKKWGILDDPKALTIRFDMPLYLSNAPFVDEKNVKFRWLFGIGRCF